MKIRSFLSHRGHRGFKALLECYMMFLLNRLEGADKNSLIFYSASDLRVIPKSKFSAEAKGVSP